MILFKNTASQKVAVYAWDRVNGVPKTGDDANITAEISLDGAASAATDDANPTELDATDHPGIYIFNLTQAETNANLIIITPSSLTSSIVFEPFTTIISTQEVMRGTNSANTTVPDAAGTASSLHSTTDDLIAALNNLSAADVTAAVPTAAAIKTAMEAEGTSDLDAIADAIAHATYGLSALQTLIAAIPTTAMRGTDGANTTVPDAAGVIAALIAALHNLSSSDVITACASALGTYDAPTKAELDAGLAALNDITVAQIIAGIADGTYDFQEMIRIIFSACSGESNGGGTSTHKYRDSADSKNRIVATVDANGNRTAVVLDGS